MIRIILPAVYGSEDVAVSFITGNATLDLCLIYKNAPQEDITLPK
jgi:hypothetical protein